MSAGNKGVLIIYTGGTIACAPRDPNNSESPLAVVSKDRFVREVPSIGLMQQKFTVDVHEVVPPLDSTEMKPENWVQIAEIIEDNYDDYEGFVVLHGTDTMAYTASALSFMLVNLAKPVVLTGAQLPIIGRTRTDGNRNLITAIEIANPAYSKLPPVKEVCILFDEFLLRGNRTSKTSASGFRGFHSPNYPPLGEVGEHIQIYADRLIRPDETKSFRLRKHLDPNVAIQLVYPGIQLTDAFRNVVQTKGQTGLILLAYGTGNVPTHKSFLDAIETAREDNQVVLVVTQCLQGAVELGAYETSAVLLDRGLVSGSDITHEAALCKMMVLLGDEDLSVADVMVAVQKDSVGEQSFSIHTHTISDTTGMLESGIAATSSRWRGAVRNVGSDWPTDEVSKVLLRFYDATMETSAPNPDADASVAIDCHIGVGSNSNLTRGAKSFAGTFVRSAADFRSMIIIDITETFKDLVSHNAPTSFTLSLAESGSGAKLAWQKAELAIMTNSNSAR